MTALSKKEMTHQRILQTAAKIIRRDGFDSLAVADLMKQAGLTHGGFYGHFASKEDLMAQTCEYAVDDILAQNRASFGEGEGTYYQRFIAGNATILLCQPLTVLPITL